MKFLIRHAGLITDTIGVFFADTKLRCLLRLIGSQTTRLHLYEVKIEETDEERQRCLCLLLWRREALTVNVS